MEQADDLEIFDNFIVFDAYMDFVLDCWISKNSRRLAGKDG